MFRFVSSILPDTAVQSLTAAYFRVNTWYKVGKGNFHSKQEEIHHTAMDISILPALSDNYMYLIVDEASKEAAIVDPVEPKYVIEEVEKRGVNLTTVLTTHHHWDHAGGNVNLVNQFPKPLIVLGGDERIGGLTQRVYHGDQYNIGNLKIECLSTPCHTQGHICYYVTNPDKRDQPPVVFTGDTLFLGGCGKFFEGNAVEMNKALNLVLASLPEETEVYCGHEYAVNNLSFALHVEPNNMEIQEKMDWVKKRRQEGFPSVPSTIGEEKLINPFMRVTKPSVQAHSKTTGAVDTMAALRAEKDNFKPHHNL